MNDAAVVATLVGGETLFGFEQHDGPMAGLDQRQCGCQPDNAATGHGDVVTRRAHGRSSRSDVVM